MEKDIKLHLSDKFIKYFINKYKWIFFGLLFIGISIFFGGILSLKEQKIKDINLELQNKTQEIKTLEQNILDIHKEYTISKEKNIELKMSSSYVRININNMIEDLKNYGLSPKIEEEIIKAIIETSKKYNINPLILYSISHVESSFRFWIEHDRVKQTINDKTIYVRAVGLNGIIWEWWEKELKENNIATSRSDLFYPKINIEAAGLIYSILRNREQLKGTNSKEESALRRYFGGNFKSYSDKINEKMIKMIYESFFEDN